MHGTEPLIIRMDGELDPIAAARAVRQIRTAGPAREVVLEFAAGTRCDLVALSLLAEAIAHQGLPVSVRGLTAHELRILEYLGVPLPRRASPDPLD